MHTPNVQPSIKHLMHRVIYHHRHRSQITAKRYISVSHSNQNA